MSQLASLASETPSQDILRCIPEALIFADVEGMIRYWNPGAEALFGYGAAEAVGRSLDLIIPERLRAAHWQGFRRAVERGATAHGGRATVTRSLHKSGQLLYVEMSFAIVKDQAGATIGSAAVARDATQRHLEQKTRQRQQAAPADGSVP